MLYPVTQLFNQIWNKFVMGFDGNFYLLLLVNLVGTCANRICRCIMPLSFVILIDDAQSNTLYSFIALRQEYCLLPDLFIICADAFLLKTTIKAKIILVIHQPTRPRVTISHLLFFADHCVLFSRATLSTVMVLLTFIRGFCTMFGQ